jgi:hypothetical protein
MSEYFGLLGTLRQKAAGLQAQIGELNEEDLSLELFMAIYRLANPAHMDSVPQLEAWLASAEGLIREAELETELARKEREALTRYAAEAEFQARRISKLQEQFLELGFGEQATLLADWTTVPSLFTSAGMHEWAVNAEARADSWAKSASDDMAIRDGLLEEAKRLRLDALGFANAGKLRITPCLANKLRQQCRGKLPLTIRGLETWLAQANPLVDQARDEAKRPAREINKVTTDDLELLRQRFASV